jgi:ribose/xylose/arabinose/galactoside ABC-type transport system permease subunit
MTTTTASRLSTPTRAETMGWLRLNGVYVALAMIIVYNVFFTPRFTTVANLNVQLTATSRILIVALGMALVIGTGGIDLSVGALMALAGAILVPLAGAPPLVAIFIALLVGALAGLLNGSLVAYAGVQPIVATLAFLVAGRGLAQLVVTGQNPSIQSDFIMKLTSGSILGVDGILLAALIPALLVFFLVRRTIFGRRLVAIGDNVRASYLSGMPVRRTLILVYVVSGLLAAWAGIIDASYITAADPRSSGINYELFAITAVVVGGTPLAGGQVRVLGTIAGAILMGLIRSTLLFHSISDSVSQMATAVIILIAVYVQRHRSRA